MDENESADAAGSKISIDFSKKEIIYLREFVLCCILRVRDAVEMESISSVTFEEYIDLAVGLERARAAYSKNPSLTLTRAQWEVLWETLHHGSGGLGLWRYYQEIAWPGETDLGRKSSEMMDRIKNTTGYR